jgi:hypothetical protein
MRRNSSSARTAAPLGREDVHEHPIGGDGFLHEVEIEVREELTLTESSCPEEAADLPVAGVTVRPGRR